jgi:FkbM family methyltransferase
MNRLALLHLADRAARPMRRAGLGRLSRAVRSLLGRRVARSLTVDFDGLRLSGDIRHRGHLYRIAANRYEPLTLALFRDSVRPGMVVLDIGAHLGLYSLIAASRAASTVYAFEPDPRTYPHLVRNIESNGMRDRVTPVRGAVSDHGGDELLYLDDGSPAVSALVAVDRSQLAVPVPCLSVDDFVAADERVDIVKLDVEGVELRAIHGMSHTIARASESLTMFIEVHPGPLHAAGCSVEAVLGELAAMGLHAQLIDERAGALKPVAERDIGAERGMQLLCRRA